MTTKIEAKSIATYAYVRVSTVEQNEARQLESLGKYDVDTWFTEKVSAKDTNRPQLQEMLSTIESYNDVINKTQRDREEKDRDYVTVVIHDFSRLARSTKDLLELVDWFEERRVKLISIKENIDTKTPTGKLMLTMIAAINEFERENLLERQREGIAIAKREGKYKGRKEVSVEDFGQHYDAYMRREISKPALAKQLGISRPTLDKLIREYEAGLNTEE